MIFPSILLGQESNYVNNGGFEIKYSCQLPNYLNIAKYWRDIDSSVTMSGVFSSCSGISNVPLNGFTYQFPRSGNSYAICGPYCPPPTCAFDYNRGYLRNRLKNTLTANKVYCVKFYVNITNTSTYGMDGFGAYFGGSELDTISKGGYPLTYLIPQVQNQSNNIITDTLNWTLVTGTFVATGNERHVVIGNFKSDTNTNKLLINPTNSPAVFTDVCIDDVSCIDIDLPALAGRDTTCIPGSSVYIGREQDVGIDEACIWYKLPNNTMAIDTVAGLWVYPTSTSTYVVRQEICGNVKLDTVVIYQDYVGLEKISRLSDEIKLFPVPAKDILDVNVSNQEYFNDFTSISIFDLMGERLLSEETSFKNKKSTVDISNLQDGVYLFMLRDKNSVTVSKRFIVAR